jgi:hypothetical protein
MTRVDADEELAAEDLPLPPLDALFTLPPDRDLGEPGFTWWHQKRYTCSVAALRLQAAAAATEEEQDDQDDDDDQQQCGRSHGASSMSRRLPGRPGA